MSVLVDGVSAVLAIPVISIVALVMTLNVRDQVRRLESRIAELERRTPVPPVRSTPRACPAAPVEPVAPAGHEPAAELRARHPYRLPTRSVHHTGRKIRYAVGRLDRRPCAGARRHLLVRYTIEQGLLGPGVRIFLAAIFSAFLIAAGEWARRNEIAAGIAAIPKQHIPSILTAAGTIAAYATVYAAFALYGFLSPAAAFVLLGLVALATLAAALLHGPALAGLGVAGAFITPLLVPRRRELLGALYLSGHRDGGGICAGALRLWRWLAVAAGAWCPLDVAGVAYPTSRNWARICFTLWRFRPCGDVDRVRSYCSVLPANAEKSMKHRPVAWRYLLAATLLVVAQCPRLPALAIFTILIAAAVLLRGAPSSVVGAAGCRMMTLCMILQWACRQLSTNLYSLPG